MCRLYIAIFIATVGIAQAAMISQTADKFKTLKEVASPIRNQNMLKGFMLGMAQQAAFFSICHAVKGPYAFKIYAGSSFVIGCAALKYSFSNFSKAWTLQHNPEQAARMVFNHMQRLLHHGDPEIQEKLQKFIPVYVAARQGQTLSNEQLKIYETSMISNVYNDLLTQYAKKSFQGFGYVLSAACGPAAALMFLTGCTFGVLPCTMEGYEI